MRTFTRIETSDGDRFTVIQLREGRVEVAANRWAVRGDSPESRLAVIDLDAGTAILVGRALIEAGEAMGGREITQDEIRTIGVAAAEKIDSPTYTLTDYGRKVLESNDFSGFSIDKVIKEIDGGDDAAG